MYIYKYIYIYIYICVCIYMYVYFQFLTKNNKYLTLHCVSSINSNRKMAAIYLVFLKAKIHQSKNKINFKVTRHFQSVIQSIA